MPVTTRSTPPRKQPLGQTVDPTTTEAPPIEPLTPIRTEQDTAALVDFRLRLPVLLTELVNTTSGLVSTEKLSEFLSTRPICERLELRRVFEKLYQCCNELCVTDRDENKDAPASPGDPIQLETASNAGPEGNSDDQSEDNPKSPIEAQYESKDELENSSKSLAESQSESEGEVADNSKTSSRLCDASENKQRPATDTTKESDTEPSGNYFGVNGCGMDLNQLVQFEVQHGETNQSEFVNPRLVTKGLNNKQQTPEEASRRSSPEMPLPLSGFDANGAATMKQITNTPSFPDGPLIACLPTPQDTPRKGREATPESITSNIDSQPFWFLMTTQSDSNFASESFDQVEKFKLPVDSSQTYRDIYASLKQERRDETRWSDGSEWKNLVETAYQDRQRSSIQYAVTAIGFSRWYGGQVQLLSTTLAPKDAAQVVTRRLLGMAREDVSKEWWKQLRNSFHTHLTRGRKWARLVDELGFGILFKNVWALAKTVDSSLTELVARLKESPGKMSILRLLGKQMDMFQEDGRTRPDILKQALGRQGLSVLSLPPHISQEVSKGVATLQALMRDSSPSGALYLQDTGLRFGIKTLDRLVETEWFNEELILLCMHLADKLPHVRVCSSVRSSVYIPRPVRSRKVSPKPFEQAARQIEEWNNAEAKDGLVCFFPIFQQNSHFSLLEINQRENSIYHYDSLGQIVEPNFLGYGILIMSAALLFLGMLVKPTPRNYGPTR
ncbi:hypothetical protein DL771_007941 [Monosporascus sp. 5C6A]|nr:hypothetical protein DL771_007941 [Monosporascus sp. 5C6A]